MNSPSPKSSPATPKSSTPALIASGVILLGLIGFGWRYVFPATDLPAGARQAIIETLQKEYAPSATAAAVTLSEGGAPATPEAAAALAEMQKKMNEVTLGRLSVRGYGRNVAVKVAVQVGGRTPPDGMDYRYLTVDHSPIRGWVATAQPDAKSYNLTFW